MAKLNFGGTVENVVTRDEFPLAKAQEVLKNETVAVIGYGVQGPGQALNQKENGVNVIVVDVSLMCILIKRNFRFCYKTKTPTE